MPLILGSATGTEESLLSLSKRLTRHREAAKPEPRFADPGEIAFFESGSHRSRYLSATPGADIARATVLIVFSAYSGWISATLITSLQTPDLLAGCWEALIRLGGMPQYLVWDSNWLHAECEKFFICSEPRLSPPMKLSRELLTRCTYTLNRNILTARHILTRAI